MAVEPPHGRRHFERASSAEHVEGMKRDFASHYSALGYVEHQPVPISSRVDPSVRFVGSHISVLKRYLLEGSLPAPGYFILQNCIRTQNVKRLWDDDYLPRWGSFFTSLGALAVAERLDDVCIETFRFFECQLDIHANSIRLRVSSQDEDLMRACLIIGRSECLEIDTQQLPYYRHKLGMDGIAARNFSIALRNAWDADYSDVGNVLIIENAQHTLAVEVALGSTTILRQLHNLDHVNDCYPILGLPPGDARIIRKLEDAMIVSTVLIREGLSPGASDNRERILRTYMRSLVYFRARTGLSLTAIGEALSAFEQNQFPGSPSKAAAIIVEYLSSYERDLRQRSPQSSEDKVVARALGVIQSE